MNKFNGSAIFHDVKEVQYTDNMLKSTSIDEH